jgi:hypothetical protein
VIKWLLWSKVKKAKLETYPAIPALPAEDIDIRQKPRPGANQKKKNFAVH